MTEEEIIRNEIVDDGKKIYIRLMEDKKNDSSKVCNILCVALVCLKYNLLSLDQYDPFDQAVYETLKKNRTPPSQPTSAEPVASGPRTEAAEEPKENS